MMWNWIFVLVLLPSYLQASIQQLGIILQHDQRFTNGVLSDYIKKLNTPKCQCVSEISVLYSDQNNKEILDLKQQASTFAIPLLFDYKPQVESAPKIRIADNSTAELYFIGSYYSKQETCQKIAESLTFAQGHQAAGLIPLVGQIEQTSVITVDNSQKSIERYFGYGHRPQLKYYQIVENIRLISRHIIQLAQSNIMEVKMMIADHPPICHQIFLNFIQAHFYPELRSRIRQFDHKLIPVDFVRTAATKTHCIMKFIDVLGYCPLFYQKKFFNESVWKNPNFQQIVQLKRVALNAEIVNSNQARRLFPKEPSTIDNQMQIQTFSSSESIVISLLIITIALMLFSIVVIRSKIQALSSPPTQAPSIISDTHS